MPVRIAPFRAALHLHLQLPPTPDCTRPQQRFFHGTPVRRDDIDDKNHYETLNLHTNASPADIKKSFYTLSKTHHPDHNRSDPHASRRFMRISEAYTVLGNTEQRAKYDRDVLRLHSQFSPSSSSSFSRDHPRGSYSSTGPAGARPASGLSRRRGTFRGPPPSFYRSGGWGAHGAKRQAAHDESAARGSSSTADNSHDNEGNDKSRGRESGGYTAYNAGGMGPGQEPFGRGSASGSTEIPHFDRAAQAAHTRTQAKVDERRARSRTRRGPQFPGVSSDFTELGSFFAVLAVLGTAFGLPYLVLRAWDMGKEKKRSERAT